jgi:probable F420-dependent oxidoreductase
MLDPYVAMGAAAAVTSRINLGTGVALIAQSEPIGLAKTIATVDHLSSGRVRLGIGFGWNAEEMANHGIDFRTRRERVEDHLAAMREIWANERATYRGRFVEFEELWSWPKCHRPGGPPVLIGGAAGPRLFEAISRYADGWMPVGGATLGKQIDRLRESFEAAGRDPAAIQIVPFGSLPTQEKLDYFASLGVSETVLRLPSASADVVESALDEYARFLS